MSNSAMTGQQHEGNVNQQEHRQQILHRLQQHRTEIIAEIRAYPPPIPACDAQYNYLLEQRAAILRELRQFEALPPTQPLTAFIAASRFLD
ncbi:MAG: hypothetical protein R2932_22085 [Caldilineaceae bacterium]